VDQRARWRAVAGRQPGMGDGALVAALRCQDEGALREFFLRFRPGLVLAARGLRVDLGERDALVDDCLADVAVHLITSDAPIPRSLPAYLARSLRNRVLNDLRSRARAERRLADEPQAAEGGFVAGSSEHAVRASAGAPETQPLSPALQHLAAALEAPLTDEERLLVVWMSRLVPHADVAAWLGISPKAAAKRIERLRERLQLAAFTYLERVDDEERGELLGFLDRAALAPRAAARLADARRVGENP
jgi:DNA-directed RNA polymerase specialized sigma24 family protein